MDYKIKNEKLKEFVELYNKLLYSTDPLSLLADYTVTISNGKLIDPDKTIDTMQKAFTSLSKGCFLALYDDRYSGMNNMTMAEVYDEVMATIIVKKEIISRLKKLEKVF